MEAPLPTLNSGPLKFFYKRRPMMTNDPADMQTTARGKYRARSSMIVELSD